MSGREIYDVMEQLNPTKQQEEQMYQNILSSSAGKEYIENRGRKKAGSNRRGIGHVSKLRYAAAVILFLVLAPTITYGAFHSHFLEKFFNNYKDAEMAQDEEWLAQYVREDMGEFSYGGYLFQLRGYLMNSKIGEGMLIINVKKEKETDYRLSVMPREDEKRYSYNLYDNSSAMDLSGDEEFKGQNLSKIIQFLPDTGNEIRQYCCEYRVTEDGSYEYRFTVYSNYQTVSNAIQQSGEKMISLNFYDGTGGQIGRIPLEQGNEITTYHWLSPSKQNNVVLTPFSIYATGVPGQMLSEGKVIVAYKDGREKEIEVMEVADYAAEHNRYRILKLDNIVNTTEVKSITVHTQDRDWYLDVENAQQ